MKKTSSQLHGVGRRKRAVARVWVKKGKGNLEVNGKKFKDYFFTGFAHDMATTSLNVSGKAKDLDVKVNVFGGGLSSQAGATRLGIARALLSEDEALRVTFRQHGLLTVDSRVKERKKYGQKGARAKFQFVKR